MNSNNIEICRGLPDWLTDYKNDYFELFATVFIQLKEVFPLVRLEVTFDQEPENGQFAQAGFCFRLVNDDILEPQGEDIEYPIGRFRFSDKKNGYEEESLIEISFFYNFDEEDWVPFCDYTLRFNTNAENEDDIFIDEGETKDLMLLFNKILACKSLYIQLETKISKFQSDANNFYINYLNSLSNT